MAKKFPTLLMLWHWLDQYPIRPKHEEHCLIFDIEKFGGISGLQPGVAHFAHLGGMLFGWLLIRHWRGQGPFAGRRGGPKMRIVR